MKDYVKRLIADYPKMVKRREELKKQLHCRTVITPEDMIETMYFSHSVGERVQSSHLSDKTSEIAIEYEEKMRKANEQIYWSVYHEYECLNEKITFLELCIEELSDLEREVMEALVLENRTWDDIEYDLNINRREIAFRRKKALSSIVRRYQQRASEIEAEILA